MAGNRKKVRINRERNWLVVERLWPGRYLIVDNNLVPPDGNGRDDPMELAMCLPDPKHQNVANLDVGVDQSEESKAWKLSLHMKVGEVEFDFSERGKLFIKAKSLKEIKVAVRFIRFTSYCAASV